MASYRTKSWGDQVLDILFTVFIISIVFGVFAIALTVTNSILSPTTNKTASSTISSGAYTTSIVQQQSSNFSSQAVIAPASHNWEFTLLIIVAGFIIGLYLGQKYIYKKEKDVKNG